MLLYDTNHTGINVQQFLSWCLSNNQALLFFSLRLGESIINGNDKTRPRNNTSCLLEEALLQACLYGTALLPAREVFRQELTEGLSLGFWKWEGKDKAPLGSVLGVFIYFYLWEYKRAEAWMGRGVEGTGCLGFPHEWHNWWWCLLQKWLRQ